MGAGQSGTTEAACSGEGGGEHPLCLPAPPCLRSSLVARVTSLGSQHSLGIGIPRHQLLAEPAPAAVVPVAQLWPSATFWAGG